MLDQAVADAAFTLPLNEISQPVQGRFGVVLTKASKIEPGVTASYDKLAQTIKSEIAIDRARNTVRDLHDKMEDERGGGASVAEAAQKVGLPVVTIEAVDRSGRAPDGGQVSGLPPGIDVVSAAFTADVGSDNDPLQLNRGPGDSGYLWYDVLGVTPSREQTLDEVKDRVLARWRDDEIDKRLRVKADTLVEELRKGAKLADLAQRSGVKVDTAKAFKRGATVTGISPAGVEAIFTTNKGDAGQANGAKSGERVVFVVTDIVEPAIDMASAESKELRDNVQRTSSDEQIAQFVAKLEQELKPSVNQAALAQATGAAAAN
jgi:peptidyl-prolyl cis-trans isomerase D